jgi:hypothetical protein
MHEMHRCLQPADQKQFLYLYLLHWFYRRNEISLYGVIEILAPVSIIRGTMSSVMGVLVSWKVASNAANRMSFTLEDIGHVSVSGSYNVGSSGGYSDDMGGNSTVTHIGDGLSSVWSLHILIRVYVVRFSWYDLIL